jgi:hypothetical protein
MGVMIPMRGELSALIFSKTMRKKDVKGAQKADEKDGGPKDGPAATQKVKGNEEEEELKNMKQGTINLLAVDAVRVSEFASYSYAFIELFAELIIGCWFLIAIIGSRTPILLKMELELTGNMCLDGKAFLPVSWLLDLLLR